MNVSCVIAGEYLRLSITHADGSHQSVEIPLSRPELLASTIKSAYERGYERGWDEAEAHYVNA